MLDTALQERDFGTPTAEATGDVDLSKEYGGAAYDPKKGWAQASHGYATTNEMGDTSTDLPVEEYIELAEGVFPAVEDNSHQFMVDNRFSYIRIPIEDFQAYEKSPLNFREWLDKYCEERGLDSRSDFAIVTRVKTLESAQRKNGIVAMPSGSVPDYIGEHFIALKQRFCPKNSRSLDTMERAMIASEKDAIARKNYLWVPHDKTQFRAHKTMKMATVPTGPHPALEGREHPLAGCNIMVERKIAHESQMDVDKLTRKFIDIGRSVQNGQVKLINAFSSGATSSSRDRKELHSTCFREERRQKAIDALGALLYAKVFEDSGMNRFLNPKKADNYSALDANALREATIVTIDNHFTPSGAAELKALVLNLPTFNSTKPAPGYRKPKLVADAA